MKWAKSNRGDLEYGYPAFERGAKFSLESSCSYFDILHYGGSNGSLVRTSSGKLDETSLKEWISKDIAKVKPGTEGSGEHFTGGLRVLLGDCVFDLENGYRIIPFTEEMFETISGHFQLPPQFIPSMTTVLSRSFKFSCYSPSISSFKPTTCFVYKVALLDMGQYHISLSYSPTQFLTYALVLYRPRFESILEDPYLSITQSLTQNPNLAIQPLFLPIVLTDLSITYSEQRIQTVNRKLNDLERSAGQHDWADLAQGDPLNLNFMEATKQLNFASRALSAEILRSKSNLLILQNLMSELNLLFPSYEGCRSQPLAVKMEQERRLLTEMIAYHTNTCDNLILRAEFEEKRMKTQIAVVYQFMAQKDAKVNLELAETTTLIAKESKKDSSAMKAIAVMTMCFLPGTFLAALFAMPFFNWDEGDVPVIKNGFKYYWAIAIPLTVLVLLVWVVGMSVSWRRLVQSSGSKGMKDDIETGARKAMKRA